jgi:AraC family transcriptional regulator
MIQTNARPSSGEGARSIWSGRVFVGIGRALYVGGASDTSPHAHHAIQICVSLDAPFRLRPGPDSAWRRHRGAVIRSDQRHQLDGSGCGVVIVYLEPESEEGRRLAVGRPGGPIQAMSPAAVRAIRAATAAAASGEVGPEAALRLCRDILAQLGVRLEQGGAPDDRIRRALLAIRADPTRRWKVAEVAEAARLSSRRFREAFSSQVGMSCRQYLLWTRLYSAMRELARGASLTEAALSAGFADAAHLTRTFRRMVGIVPSAIARSVCFMERLV